jgi:hypothetical protein
MNNILTNAGLAADAGVLRMDLVDQAQSQHTAVDAVVKAALVAAVL